MKRALLLTLTLVCALGLTAPVFGAPRSANGMSVDPAPDAEPNMSVEAAPLGGGFSGTGYTGVDDLSPCFFVYTVPLSKTWYRSYGIQFKGPNATDGGAVLDECGGGWSISGFTGPNILGFNCLATMANGGRPVGPETLLFTPTVDAVQFSIGSGDDAGSIVEVIAKNVDGGTVDSQTVVLSSAMQTVFLMGSKKIKKVIIGAGQSNACIFAMDNIYWGTP